MKKAEFVLSGKCRIGDVGENPKLNGWYKRAGKSMFYISCIKNGIGYGFGFDRNGVWFKESHENPLYIDSLIESTKEKVESSLYKEAKRRYNIGDEVSRIDSRNTGNYPSEKKGSNFKIRDIDEPALHIDDEGTLFYLGNLLLFKDGVWAEVINPQQSSLEQDIQQLKDKYKQYKFTITIEDNI